MDYLFDLLAFRLGVDTEMLVLYLGLLVAVCNIIGRLIPDSATGVLGIVRKAAKIVGLYVSNRVSPGVSVNDTSRAIAASAPDLVIQNTADALPEAIAHGMAAGGLASTLVDVAKGYKAGKPYVAGESPEPGSTVPDQFRTDPLVSGAAKTRSR